MTAWQDLPPRTRRQARLNERENLADEFERAPRNSDEDSAPAETESVEPRDLVTAYSRRSRRAAGAPTAEESSPVVPAGTPAAEGRQADFRVRDFRPEATPSLPTGTPPASAVAEPTRDLPLWTPPSADDDGRISYQTQAVPMEAKPASPPTVVHSVPPELAAPPRPMTRRELRELEIQQGLRKQAEDGPEAESEMTAPGGQAPAPATPAPPAPSTAALAPPASAAPAPAAPAPAAPPPSVPALVVPPAFTAPAAEPTPPPVVRPAPPVPVPAPAAPPPVSLVVSPEPVVFTDASGSAPANWSSVAPIPVRQANAVPQSAAGSLAVNRGIDSAPEIFGAPDANWQTQANIEVANQPGDSFVRRVGGNSAALTTNALVIPSIPQASDITRPFSSTGEILVTGSIDLPMTLGSTGATPARFDHSDIDALFAKEDHDYAQADSAPVRAIRAVSTHTSTHGVISAKKPANNRLPMMMAVTAGILAVSVAALFAAALIFGYL